MLCINTVENLDIKGNHSFVSSTLAKDAVTHCHNNWDLGFINKENSLDSELVLSTGIRSWTSCFNQLGHRMDFISAVID